MESKQNFYSKLEEYPKTEIKGYTFSHKIEIDKQIDEERSITGEESLFIDIDLKGNVIIRYRETINSFAFKSAYEQICKLFEI